MSTLELLDDVTTMDYQGLKLAFQRRSVNGVRLNGNWTWGRCMGGVIVRGGSGDGDNGGGAAYENSADLDYDRGHCNWDQTHLANVTVGYLSPQMAGALGALASNWQFSGIVGGRSGDWLTVTTGVTAFTGSVNTSRVDQVSDDVYGDKTLANYLNRAAFAQPAPGTFGNHKRNSIKGPGAWKADLAVSRLFSWGAAQKVELRFETFNLFNTFNWGNPITTLSSGNFGRIQTDQRRSPHPAVRDQVRVLEEGAHEDACCGCRSPRSAGRAAGGLCPGGAESDGRVLDRLRRYANLGEGRRPSRAETAGRETGSVRPLGARRREQRFRDRRRDEARASSRPTCSPGPRSSWTRGRRRTNPTPPACRWRRLRPCTRTHGASSSRTPGGE